MTRDESLELFLTHMKTLYEVFKLEFECRPETFVDWPGKKIEFTFDSHCRDRSPGIGDKIERGYDRDYLFGVRIKEVIKEYSAAIGLPYASSTTFIEPYSGTYVVATVRFFSEEDTFILRPV